MEHPPIQDWADFARGLASPKKGARMQRHVDDGCQKCMKEFQLWNTVLSRVGRESEHQPPEGSVRIVKAAFALRKPRALMRAAKLTRLLLDSLRQPLPAGVRSHADAPRHLLYEAGPFRLDVRLERFPASNRVAVVGQLLTTIPKAATEKETGLRPVIVTGKKKAVLASTFTNRLGEFQLEFKADEDMWLFIPTGTETPIVVNLPELKEKGRKRRQRDPAE